MMNTQLLEQTIHLLKTAKCPLLIAHPRPDGDTIGCTLALRLALLQLGSDPTIACVHPVPANLAYLPGADSFVRAVDDDAEFDLVVAVDMSDLKRTGGIYKETWRGHIPLLVIDHHETNEAFGDVNFVDHEAAATAVPATRLLDALGVSWEADIATCLLVALLTDTRGLRTETTTPAVLALVARLIDSGGDYAHVMQQTLDSVPYQQMRGWGIALNRLQLEDNLAWTTFPLGEKQKLGIEDHDDLDLGNLLSRLAEANVIATFLEMHDGTVKISFRARPGYNVAGIAKHLGGGGHRQAAGCSVSGALNDVVAQVLPLVRQILDA